MSFCPFKVDVLGNGERLDQLAAALTKLSKSGGAVRGVDLLEDRDWERE